MGVRAVDPQDVASRAVQALGLDASATDLLSGEALAASLRRAASFLCPATAGTLVRAVTEALAGLPGHDDGISAQVEDTLASLIAYGDLLELPVKDQDTTRRQLFLGAPAFVRRSSGACLLIGVRPEGAPLLDGDLLANVEYDGHVRLIRENDRPLGELLAAQGLFELQADQWLGSPPTTSAQDLLGAYEARLNAAGPAGDVDGLRLIDPAAPVTYYRGRWRPPTATDSGFYVARRPQAYGADLWCFVDVVRGQTKRLIDLPVESLLAPAADEAWRLQAAIDAVNGHHQLVQVRASGRSGESVVDLFSPVPSWVQRRLDVVGRPLLRSRGALMSYILADHELHEELRLLRDMMWTRQVTAEGMADG